MLLLQCHACGVAIELDTCDLRDLFEVNPHCHANDDHEERILVEPLGWRTDNRGRHFCALCKDDPQPTTERSFYPLLVDIFQSEN